MTTCHKKILMMNVNKTKFSLSVLTASLIAMSMSAYADQSLIAMSVTETSPGLTQLRLDFDSAPVAPAAYQTDAPPQLILDFSNVNNALPSKLNKISQGAIDKVTTISNDSTTRMVIDIDGDVNQPGAQPANYATQVVGNSLLLNITSSNTTANLSSSSSPMTIHNAAYNNSPPPQTSYNPTHTNNDGYVSTASTVPVATTNSNTNSQEPQQTMVVRVNPLLNPALAQQATRQYNYDGISDINYSPDGNVSITLVNPSIPVDVQRQGRKIVIRLTGATIPSDLTRRMNIGGLVSTIDANNQGQNGVITVTMAQDFEYQAYQSNNELNLNVSPPELLREPTLEEKVYSGEPLSLEFQDMPIRSVLDVLAEFTDLNLVVSDNVSGNLTLRLYDVPWDQALDIILKSKNLDKRVNGNVVLIGPAAELARQEAEQLEQQQKVQTFLPLRTEYIRLSYAIAGDVLTLISSGRNSGNNDNSNSSSLLSGRGTVTVDERTNTLIVQDTAESIENIRQLVEKIDIPVRQVMIEARIVSATDSFSKSMGVKWGILSNGAATNRNLLVGGSTQTLDDLRDFNVETATVNGQEVSYPSYTITKPDNLNVDLGAGNAAGRIAFGLLSLSDVMIDLELSAMQADGRGEIISTPKVLTMDKQTARVASGTQIPYQEASASGATSTSFAEAALSLEVTPNITPDGKIALQLNIENGRPNILNGSVAINTDSLETNVIVEDGQTIVLGGIFRNQIQDSDAKVPFLGDLPYVGKLFRTESQTNDKQELLIFVTPKLINDGVSRIN